MIFNIKLKRKLERIFKFLFFLLFFLDLAWSEVVLKSVNFDSQDNFSSITIESDSPLNYEKKEDFDNRKFILEIPNAILSDNAKNQLDTTFLDNFISSIVPSQVTDPIKKVSILIQLKSLVKLDIVEENNKLKINLSPLDKQSSGSLEENKKIDLKKDQSAKKSEKSNLDNFFESQKLQQFVGKSITLQVRDADITDVLRMIGETSGFNTVIGSDVVGKMTLSLVDVPWDQALDLVLNANRLGAERKNNILRVATIKNLVEEREQARRAEALVKANAPRITRVFPINYAKLSDLQALLTKFALQNSNGLSASSSMGSSPSGGNVAQVVVQSDVRTNSLVIQDTLENLDKMKKLIELLDTQTPQVLIEAKVIEAKDDFSKRLGGSLGFGKVTGDPFFATFAGGNPLDPLVGTPGVFSSGSDIGKLSNPQSGSPLGYFGISPSVSFIPGVNRINATLSWGESENLIKIVSAPKMVVLNKEQASIIEGTPVLVPGTTTLAGVGTSVPTATVQQANVSLSVKPTVTNDGSVLMELSVTKDVPQPISDGQNGIANRKIDTQVLVESGSTLVIGGIYSAQTNRTSSGFPYLRKLPLVGTLFGSETEQMLRTEIFIFVTPRILNLKEAGLGVDG